METVEVKENSIFGSFFIGGSEFALSVTNVREVVGALDKYTSVPLAPAYLRGIFNLRGAIIPVVDLSSILKIPRSAELEAQRIAIVDYGEYSIGLLFDRTGEIFKARSEEKSDFHSSGSENVIKGVFKREDGKRIVQIFDIEALFALQGVPKQQGIASRRKEGLSRKLGHRKQCISFRVGDSRCALGIDEIQEILSVERVAEQGLATNYSIGVISLRGATVPVVDFVALLGYRELDKSNEATRGDRRIIVVAIENRLVGLLVDCIESIVTYFPDDLIPFPLLNHERADMFVGCIHVADQLDILLLNFRRLFSDTEIISITHGHSNLYNNVAAKDRSLKARSGHRRTFITFVVETTYAVSIEDVKEIIEYPKKMLQPPGLARHFDGVLNLRGELVTIVDARAMYSSKNASDDVNKKVLVFKRKNAHFGLVVDCVEAIVSFSESDRINLPQHLHKGDSNGLIEDVADAVQVSGGQQDKTLLILNADKIAARVSGVKAA